MEIDNKTARSNTPLLFDIQTSHLTDCYNPKRLMHQFTSALTVKHPFRVVNTGEIPFWIVNMSINNEPCQNRGFRILNCEPFWLDPGESIQLEVA